MAFADPGTLVTHTGWNSLTTKVNKVFGDFTPNSSPSTDSATQEAYKFGWGNSAQASDVAQGDLIEASVFNSAIDIVNAVFGSSDNVFDAVFCSCLNIFATIFCGGVDAFNTIFRCAIDILD